jgi:hypothetical protein
MCRNVGQEDRESVLKQHMMTNLRIRNRLAVYVTTLLALLLVGCGSSSDFVTTSTGTDPSTSGTLVFRFQKATAQTVHTVPAATTQLRFEFYSSELQTDSTLLFTETRNFAEVVTFNDVTVVVVSVRVTPLNQDGLPLFTHSATPVVVPGGVLEVELSDPVQIDLQSIGVTPDPVQLSLILFDPFPAVPSIPAQVTNNDNATAQLTVTGTFSDGSVLQLPIDDVVFTGTNGIVTIDESGLVTLGSMDDCGQNVTTSASYSLNGVTQISDFLISTYCLEAHSSGTAEASPGATYSGGFEGTLLDDDGSSVALGTPDFTYGMEGVVTGITVNPTSGLVSVDGGVAVGTNFVVLVTFLDDRPEGSGLSFTTELDFSVVSP